MATVDSRGRDWPGAGSSSDSPHAGLGQEATAGTHSSSRKHCRASRIRDISKGQGCGGPTAPSSTRSGHGWWHGAKLRSSAEQQCPSMSEKEGCRQVASGSERRREVAADPSSR